MNGRSSLYAASMRAARILATAIAPFRADVRGFAETRRESHRELLQWADSSRDPGRPLVWVHAPSVGEGLMAQAIIASLREIEPSSQIVFTHFSPSALRVRDTIGADIATWLPWDTYNVTTPLVAALQPQAIVFVRSEIWPTLMRSVQDRGGKAALVNAVLAPDSSRLRQPGRYLFSPAYAALDAVGVVNADVAARMTRLGARSKTIQVTGDARFDQVWSRIQRIDAGEWLRLKSNAFTVVAGSTWPADEAVLIPAMEALLSDVPGARFLIAPHQPDASHVASLLARLRSAGIGAMKLSEAQAATASAVVIDRVGILADLYAIADAAYVGGGFHGAGLHSVVEPAALSVPVIIGPRHQNAAEAAELMMSGGGTEITDANTLVAVLRRFQSDSVHRLRAAESARAFVEQRLGGAQNNARMIAGLLRGQTQSRLGG